jgi:hypothetical protein
LGKVVLVEEPTYPLDRIKQLFQQDRWIVTTTALNSALELGLDDEDIFDCIVNHLSETHFCKTMPAEKKPGLMQDVYRVTYEKQGIYLKLQVANDWAVVISFKEE